MISQQRSAEFRYSNIISHILLESYTFGQLSDSSHIQFVVTCHECILSCFCFFLSFLLPIYYTM